MMDAGVGPRGSMIVWFYFTRSHTGWGVAARCKIAAPPAPHCGFGTHRTAASARTAPRLGGYGAFAFKNAHFTRELDLHPVSPCAAPRLAPSTSLARAVHVSCVRRGGRRAWHAAWGEVLYPFCVHTGRVPFTALPCCVHPYVLRCVYLACT